MKDNDGGYHSKEWDRIKRDFKKALKKYNIKFF